MADKSDPFQSSSREFGSDLLADEDDTEKKKKRLQTLMNRLKMKSSRLGSLMDCAQNFSKAIAEKRAQHPIEVSQLDKIQQNFSARTLPLMLDRLSMCARHAGLTFSKMKSTTSSSTNPRFPYWSASIGTDRFQVEIQVSQKGKVEDVFVSLMQATDGVVPRRNSVLFKILRSNNFKHFTEHLTGYSNIYKPIIDRSKNHLCFVVLEAMESNIEALAYGQSVSTANQICHSSVGNITPRNAGLPLKSTYFIGPYDLLIPKSSTKHPIDDLSEKNIGQSFTLELHSSDPHPFFVKPIYANNKSTDGTSSLVETNQKEWIELPAVFVMKLKQGLPISKNTLKLIQSATEIEFKNIPDYQPLLPLIIDNAIHNKQNKTKYCDHKQHQKSVYLPGWKHHYYIGEDSTMNMQEPRDTQTPNSMNNDADDDDDVVLQGCIIDAIPFITANCIVHVISLLRQQTAFNAVIESCVRQPNTGLPPCSNVIGKPLCPVGSSHSSPILNPDVRVFQLNADSLQRISVIFEDPINTCLASCDFDMSDLESLNCELVCPLQEENDICSNSYLSQVFQRSLSLPITMRAVFRKASEKILSLNQEKVNSVEVENASESVCTERQTLNPMLASLLDDTPSKTTTPATSPPAPLQADSPQSPCPSKRRKFLDQHTSPLSSAALLLTAHKRPIRPPPPLPPPPPAPVVPSIANSQPLRVPPLPFDHANNTTNNSTNQNEMPSLLKHHSSSEINSPLRLPTYTTNPMQHNSTNNSSQQPQNHPTSTNSQSQSNGLTSPNWTAAAPQSSQSNFHCRTVSEPTANASGDTRFKGGGVSRVLASSDRKSLGSTESNHLAQTVESDPFDFNASLGVQASMPSPADGLTASDSLQDVDRIKKESSRPLSGGKTKSTLTVKLNTKLINKDASMPNDSASMKRPRSKDSLMCEDELSAKASHKKQKLLAKQNSINKKRKCDTSPNDKKRESNMSKMTKTSSTSRVYDFDADLIDAIGSGASNDVPSPPDTPPKTTIDSTMQRSKPAPPKIKISGGRVHSILPSSKSKDKSVKNMLNSSVQGKSRSKDAKESKSIQQTCYTPTGVSKGASSKQSKQTTPNHCLQKTSSVSSPITVGGSLTSNPVANNNVKTEKTAKISPKDLPSSLPTSSNGSDSKPAPIRNRKSSLTAVIDKLTKTKQTTPAEKLSKTIEKPSKQSIPPPDEGPKTKASADMIRLMILSQGNLPSTPPKDSASGASTPGTSCPESASLLAPQVTPPVGKVPLAKIPSRTPTSVPITTSPPTTNNTSSISKPITSKETLKSTIKECRVKVPNLLSSNSFNNSSNNNKQPKYANSPSNATTPLTNNRSYQSSQHRGRPVSNTHLSNKNNSDQTSPARASLLPTPTSHFDPSRPSPPLVPSKPIAPYQRGGTSFPQNKLPVSILKNSMKRDPSLERLSNGDSRSSNDSSRKSPLTIASGGSCGKPLLQPILPPPSNSNPASPVLDDGDFGDAPPSDQLEDQAGHQSTVLAQPLNNDSPDCSPRDSDDEDEDAFFIDDALTTSPTAVQESPSIANDSSTTHANSTATVDKFASLRTLDNTLSPQVCREDELQNHGNNSVMISEKS